MVSMAARHSAAGQLPELLGRSLERPSGGHVTRTYGLYRLQVEGFF